MTAKRSSGALSCIKASRITLDLQRFPALAVMGAWGAEHAGDVGRARVVDLQAVLDAKRLEAVRVVLPGCTIHHLGQRPIHVKA